MAKHIIATLNTVLPTEQTWRLKILQQWPHIIGTLAKKVKLHKVEETSIVLSVAHPGLAHELLMLTDLIRDKINAVIGRPQIRAIHFRNTHRKVKHPTQKPIQKRAITEQRSLDQSEQKMLATIENDDLRAALSSFHRTCKTRTTS